MRATYITHAFPKHCHDSFGIGVIETGTLAYHTKAGQYLIPAGNLVVINPGQVHWGGAADATGFSYRILYPDPVILAQIIQSITDRQLTAPYFPISHLQDRGLARRLLQLHTALEAESALKLQCESGLITMLARLITRHAQAPPALPTLGPERQAVQHVRDYLEACYSENVSLEQLARLANLKPLRLLRVFRKVVGLPPHAYLIQVRINQAKHFLKSGMAIAQVAVETGFTDQSHLTRHFKRFVGVTPKQYVQGCS